MGRLLRVALQRGAYCRSRCLAPLATRFSRALSTYGVGDVPPPLLGLDNKGRSEVRGFSPSFLSPCCTSRPFASKAGGGDVEEKVPTMGESITEGTISKWMKKLGDYVHEGEVVAVIDTDKVSVDVDAKQPGVLKSIAADVDEVVFVGNALFTIDTSAPPPSGAVAAPPPSASAASPSPPPTFASSVPLSTESASPPPPPAAPIAKEKKSSSPPAAPRPSTFGSERLERRVVMSRMRQRIAERLKGAQNMAAMLTTFNKVDMSRLMEMRKELGDSFKDHHGIKLGFMSAFLLASAKALQRKPEVNAFIDNKEIVYREYVDISVAVATPTGLMVPVIRDCHRKSMVDLERDVADLALRARDGKIALEEMAGGTFTISNGGVYGSLFGTPILNPPQSAILGMHSIEMTPVVVGKEIVARPMMYLALTYDHRLVDGREAVTFLNAIKDAIQDPRRLLLEI